MSGTSTELSLATRAAIYGTAHVVALVLLAVLLEVYEPEPGGFRFDSIGKVAGLAVATVPPVLLGFFAIRRGAVLLIAAIHALSPLLLTGNMANPDSDLNFAVLMWWVPLPVVVVMIGLIDRWRSWVQANR